LVDAARAMSDDDITRAAPFPGGDAMHRRGRGVSTTRQRGDAAMERDHGDEACRDAAMTR
jgi:hypothetical protein